MAPILEMSTPGVYVPVRGCPVTVICINDSGQSDRTAPWRTGERSPWQDVLIVVVVVVQRLRPGQLCIICAEREYRMSQGGGGPVSKPIAALVRFLCTLPGGEWRHDRRSGQPGPGQFVNARRPPFGRVDYRQLILQFSFSQLST